MTSSSSLKMFAACFFTAALASIPACGSAEVDEEEYAGLSKEEATAPNEEEAQASAQESEDVAEAEQAEITCALEYVEPCIAAAAICAVRCCDDTLHKSVQLCGNCGVWATGACTYHGGRKRVRWE